MLVSASGVTVLLGLMILAAYTWGSVRSANKVNTMQTTVTVVVELVHIGLWIAVSVLYREGKTGKDLWGWACSDAADRIQKNFDGVVDFNKVCNRGVSHPFPFFFLVSSFIAASVDAVNLQTVNWVLSIANAGFTIFNLSIWYWVLKRRSYTKVGEQMAERRLLGRTDF